MHRTPREKSRLPALQDWLTLQVLTHIKVSTSSSEVSVGFTYSCSAELPLLGKRVSMSLVRYSSLNSNAANLCNSPGEVEKIRQVLTDFIQHHGYISSSALLWLYSPVFIAFSQREIRIPPFSAAAEPEDYAMQHAGEHHAPALQTCLETEHYVARNKKTQSRSQMKIRQKEDLEYLFGKNRRQRSNICLKLNLCNSRSSDSAIASFQTEGNGSRRC